MHMEFACFLRFMVPTFKECTRHLYVSCGSGSILLRMHMEIVCFLRCSAKKLHTYNVCLGCWFELLDFLVRKENKYKTTKHMSG